MFKDRYTAQKLLGSGATGRVLLAHDKKLNKDWAVKEVRLLGGRDNGALAGASLKAEINFLKSLDHRALPRIVDIYEEEHCVYIVMDYVQGSTLKQLAKKNGGFSAREVAEIGIAICDILTYLHTRKRPVIYRDLKPSNIILSGDGEVRLVDLGGCAYFSALGDGLCIGSRRYAAPEQLSGFADARSDIYSLGKTMEAIASKGGRAGALGRIVKRCCMADAGKRYKSAARLKRALMGVKNRQRRWLLAAAALVAAALMLKVAPTMGQTGEARPADISDEALTPDISDEALPAAAVPDTDLAGVAADERMAAVKENLDTAGGFLSRQHLGAVELGKALGFLEEARLLLLELEKAGINDSEEIKLERTKYKIENLSMLSTIYKLLGRRSESGRQRYYEQAEDYIEELFEIKGVRESAIYRLKLSDLVSIKDELGKKEEAINCLKEWETEHPGVGKEFYFAHALILLRDEGNEEALKELYEEMASSKEVCSDFRYEDISRQIERYLERKEVRDE